MSYYYSSLSLRGISSNTFTVICKIERTATMEAPPQPPPVPRLPLTCDRHPSESFTGFCPSCLRERLRSLESASTTSTTHRNSTSTISSSLKSIFFNKPLNPASSSLQPELRRCKSFSCSGPRLSTSGFEPQRRSCDARGGRHTLWSLFNQETFTGSHAVAEILPDRGEITAAAAIEIVEIDAVEEARPMKDHIDLESQAAKKPATSFWLAASVFSKKLQKWRTKQKMKKAKKQQEEEEDVNAAKPSSRRFRETQSEVAVDAFGRRSCDLGPRFSLDAGRISFDDPRYSFDEPRASWDGYLIGGGGRSVLPRLMPMLSVVEDVPTPVVQRSDGQIPVEEDLTVPGGSQQTKDYYSDSSSRSRRRSFDRSSSVKKVSMEMNEAKPVVSNAKVSPAGSTEFIRDWSSNSLRDDLSESFESAFREVSSHKLPPRKKSKRWSKAWSIWGLIHRRSSSRGGGDNVVERSFSETWPELRVNGYSNGYANGRILRSNSNVSSRSSIYGNAGFGSTRKNGSLGMNGIGKKGRDEFVLERNRSARYSPGHVDNGMLRFYLTPMRGSRRGSGMSRPNSSYHSFTRSVLGLY